MYNIGYMWHVNYMSHIQIKWLIFCENCCEKICKPHLNTFNKKWRQEKPKRRQKYEPTWIFAKKCPFWAYIRRNQHIHYLKHGHSSWFTFGLPSVGPKAFKTDFLRSRTMEVGPWTLTIEKSLLSYSDFMVHSVNQPLDFMTLNIMKLDIFFIFLAFIINMRRSLQKFLWTNQFDVILSCFKQTLNNHMFNIFTCTLLAPSSKICRFFLKFFMAP